MKKFSLLMLLFFTLFSISCSEESSESSESSEKLSFKLPNESFIQKYLKNTQIDLSLNSKLPAVSSGPCDNAASVGISMQTDFEFKRPKYDCQRGFWFCSETHYYYNCYDSGGNLIYQEEIGGGNRVSNENIPNYKYTVKVNFFEEDNEMLLTFPKEYFLDGTYTQDDMSYFSVDEEIEIVPNSGIYFVKGQYEVFEYENEIYVLVKTKEI